MAVALEATAGTHPTVEELFAQVQVALPTVSLATVYNVLAALVAAGFVLEVDVAGSPRRYDVLPDGQPEAGEAAGPATLHAHVQCVRCGRLDDVDLPPSIWQSLAELVREQTQYETAGRGPVVFGRCARCR